jgi:hypothetical protein
VTTELDRPVPAPPPESTAHGKGRSSWKWWLLALVVVAGAGLVGRQVSEITHPVFCAGSTTSTSGLSATDGVNLKGGDIGKAMTIDDDGVPVRVTLDRAVTQIPISNAIIQPFQIVTNNCPYLGLALSLHDIGTAPAPMTVTTHEGDTTEETTGLSVVINVAHGSGEDSCSTTDTPLGPTLPCSGAQPIPPGGTISGWYVTQLIGSNPSSVEIQMDKRFATWTL